MTTSLTPGNVPFRTLADWMTGLVGFGLNFKIMEGIIFLELQNRRSLADITAKQEECNIKPKAFAVLHFGIACPTGKHADQIVELSNQLILHPFDQHRGDPTAQLIFQQSVPVPFFYGKMPADEANQEIPEFQIFLQCLLDVSLLFAF